MKKVSYKPGPRSFSTFTVIVIHNLQTNSAMNPCTPEALFSLQPVEHKGPHSTVCRVQEGDTGSISRLGKGTGNKSGKGNILLVHVCPRSILPNLKAVLQSSSVPMGT